MLKSEVSIINDDVLYYFDILIFLMLGCSLYYYILFYSTCWTKKVHTYTSTIHELLLSLISAAIGTYPLIIIEEFDNSGGLRLLCECKGWNPEPELLWLDSEGDVLISDTTETHKDAKGFSVKHRITVHNSETKYHCRVKLRHHMLQTDISVSSKYMIYHAVENVFPSLQEISQVEKFQMPKIRQRRSSSWLSNDLTRKFNSYTFSSNLFNQWAYIGLL